MACVDKYGFDFDGATALVLQNSLQNLTDNNFTLLFNTKDLDANEFHTILATQNNDTQTGFSLRILPSTNTIYWRERYTGNESQINCTPIIDLTDDVYIAFVFNSSNISNSKIYINNIEQSVSIVSGIGSKVKSNDTFIGKLFSSGIQNFYKGLLFDIKLYDSTLSPLEIESEKTQNNIQTIGYWTLNQNTLDSSGNNNNGVVNGLEQYKIISSVCDLNSKSLVNLYIEPFNYNTDFLYKNKTALGYGSIPAISFIDEADYRLLNDFILIKTSDVCTILDIKSLDYTTNIATNIYRLNINAITSGNVDLYGIFKAGSFSVIETLEIEATFKNYDIDLNNYDGLESLLFINPSIAFQIEITSDINIECWTNGVEINVEGINVSVDTNLKSYVTLANTIVTNKLAKTQYAYTTDLILTDEEFQQLNDFINLARYYKRKIMLEVDIQETVGNMIAGTPDLDTQVFTLANLQTSENTGLYKYVTITYFNDKSNKVR